MAADLTTLVYDRLRRLARQQLAREREGHTLQPTALVHEAWMRLADQERAIWKGKTHFIAVAAQCMRRVLIDHARGRLREKRGGDVQHVTLGDALLVAKRDLDPDDVLALEEALEQLAAIDARQAQVVELRYFGGLTMDEIAETLGVSKRTVEDEWTHARAWLRRALTE